MTSNWAAKPLLQLSLRISDGSHNPPKGIEFSDFLMLSSKNVFDDRITLDSPRYLSAKDFSAEDRRTAIAPGDVLLTIVGTIGRTAVVPAGLGALTLQRSVAVIRPDPCSMDSRFLMYALINSNDTLNSQARGVAQKGIYLEVLRDFRIPHPLLPEQRRIVAILDEALEAIATAKANTEKNLQNSRKLIGIGYESILGSFDQSQWSSVPVAALAAAGKGSMRTGPFGSQLLHSEFVDVGIAVLGIDNAVANEFRWDKRRHITEEKYRDLARYRVHPGDVLITIMGTCGRCAVVPEDVPLAINTKHLCCITLDRKKCIPNYLHLYFVHDPMARSYLTAQAKGSIMAGLNMGIISALPVRLPPLDQQSSLVERVESLKAECDRLFAVQSRKLAALDELKRSLLHQAFSGGLTAKSTDRQVAETA